MTLKTWNHVSRCLLAATLIVAMAGCASTGSGKTGGASKTSGGAAKTSTGGAAPAKTAAKAPTDQEMIQKMMIDVMAALTAKDIDKMVSYYADDFHSDNGDKAATVAFLNGAKDQGFLDGIVVKTDAMKIDVQGETAKVGPVNLEGAFGALGLNFDLAKRAGKWLVVSQSTQM
jgi:hypothetical protein